MPLQCRRHINVSDHFLTLIFTRLKYKKYDGVASRIIHVKFMNSSIFHYWQTCMKPTDAETFKRGYFKKLFHTFNVFLNGLLSFN